MPRTVKDFPPRKKRRDPLADAHEETRRLRNRIFELEQRQQPDRAALNEVTTKHDRLAKQVTGLIRQNQAYQALLVAIANLAHELLATGKEPP